MSIVRRPLLAFLLTASFLCMCTQTDDTVRLKRREILYHFTPLSDECIAMFGAGAIRATTPESILALVAEDMSNLGYLSIKNNLLSITLPWPYDDIVTPVTVERNEYAYHIKGEGEKVTISFTAYALDETTAVLRIDGKMCYPMPQFLAEHVLANLIKNIVKTLRDRRG